MDRDSPQFTGKERKHAIEGDGSPAIRACSNIAWLYWKEFALLEGVWWQQWPCQESDLFPVVVDHQQGDSSYRLVRHSKCCSWNVEFPAWGGCEFDADTPEGQAILGRSSHFEMGL